MEGIWMKKLVIHLGLYIIAVIWFLVGVIIADNMYAISQRTYTGIIELYAFIAFWFGLSFLLTLIRSRMSVSMPVKAVMIASAVSLAVSVVIVAVTFNYIMLHFYFGNLFFLLMLLAIVADLFDMVCAAVRKNRT